MEKGLKQENNICLICERKISEISAARVSHMRKHVRDGSIKEGKDESGKLMWKTTGKDPKEKSAINWNVHTEPKNIVPPRQKITAKSDKKGKISICCRKCGKMKPSRNFGADERFIVANCCDAITLFPQRMVETLVSNPGQKYVE